MGWGVQKINLPIHCSRATSIMKYYNLDLFSHTKAYFLREGLNERELLKLVHSSQSECAKMKVFFESIDFRFLSVKSYILTDMLNVSMHAWERVFLPIYCRYI